MRRVAQRVIRTGRRALVLLALAGTGSLLAQAPLPTPTAAPPSAPTARPAPTPAPESRPGEAFVPSEELPADAEVDFPGDI